MSSGVDATLYAGDYALSTLCLGRSVRFRQQVGTVAVTAIGMFAGGAGHATAPPTPMSRQVVVGGMTGADPHEVVDGNDPAASTATTGWSDSSSPTGCTTAKEGLRRDPGTIGDQR